MNVNSQYIQNILNKKLEKKEWNQLKHQDAVLLSTIFPLKDSITTANKPSNQLFKLMLVSKDWCCIAKGLFERDAEVHIAFFKQLTLLKPLSNACANTNTFFFMWMMQFLKNNPNCKIEELKDKENELNKKLFTIIREDTSIFNAIYWSRSGGQNSGSPIQNSCTSIIEQAFKGPVIKAEITNAELCQFLNFSFSSLEKMLGYKSSYIYEIVIHIIKDTQLSSFFGLINKLEERIDAVLDKIASSVMHANDISRLINRIGDYNLNNWSHNEMKMSYVTLIKKILDKLTENLTRNQLQDLHVNYIKYQPNNQKTVPNEFWQITFELLSNPEKYALVEDQINSIKEKFLTFDIALNIEKEPARRHFIKEIVKIKKSFTCEQMTQLVDHLKKNNNIFLEKMKDYTALIEKMYSKMPANSDEEKTQKTKALEAIEFFFQEVQKGLNVQKSSSDRDDVIRMNGFLKYLKMISK